MRVVQRPAGPAAAPVGLPDKIDMVLISSLVCCTVCKRGLVAAVLVAALGCAPAWAAFGLANVQSMARELASKPYQKPADDLAPALASLTREQYRSISQEPAARLWAAARTPFSVEFLARGNNYHDRVKINEVDVAGVHAMDFDGDDFDFGELALDPDVRAHAGFSGFALHLRVPQAVPTLSPDTPALALHEAADDRFLVFQGASFFYALARDQVEPGAMARALALDTGLMSGEEFPRFTEFWIERPSASDSAVVVLALLDSPRAAGAYRFAIYPGATLRMDVSARLYLRDYVTALGLAPLGSMYLHGENDRRQDPQDYRPEQHDADGLQIHSGTGEWLWRPLLNPKRLLMTSFAMSNPQGFGLMQRDRDFASYQDLGRRYELSPSAWVTPVGNWGPGRIELVLLPTQDATNDNVVAFWVPEASLKPQQAFDFAYGLEWPMSAAASTRPGTSWVTQTRTYAIAAPEQGKDLGLVLDFEGPALDALQPADVVTSQVASNEDGQVVAQRVVYNAVTGGRRLFLQVRRADPGKPLELRAFLRAAGDTVSETWSYIVPGEE